MWEMKEWGLGFFVHALWRRRKGLFYVVSAVSIAGNLVVLVGPEILSYGCPTAVAELLQMALHAASAMRATPMRAWNALPDLAHQRSLPSIVLNLILASIVFKSGVLSLLRAPSQPTSMKLEELHSFSNLQNVCGSHWLAPSYLNTVFSTMLNFADESTRPSMQSLVQHAYHVQGKGNATIIDASTLRLSRTQKHLIKHYSPNDSLSNAVPVLDATPPAAAFPAPSSPSLFTIEPLDELMHSMQQPSHETPILEAQMSKNMLRKVDTKVDLLQAVRARQWKESRLKAKEPMQQKKSMKSMQGGKGKQYGIRRSEEQVRNIVRPMKESNSGTGDEKIERKGEDEGGDDDELSRQEFNERVDTFICKFKRNLTMQRKESLNRLQDYIRLTFPTHYIP